MFKTLVTLTLTIVMRKVFQTLEDVPMEKVVIIDMVK